MGQLCIYMFNHIEARVASYKSSARKSSEHPVYFVYHTCGVFGIVLTVYCVMCIVYDFIPIIVSCDNVIVLTVYCVMCILYYFIPIIVQRDNV